MHNNYYFIKRLAAELKPILIGRHLVECYSQERDDMILSFSEHFFVRCHFTRQFSCLSFPDSPKRAKRNTVDLFTELKGLEITDLIQHENERSFRLHFTDGYVLLFKLHGNNSNLLLFRNREIISIFKNNLRNDLLINYEELNQPLQQDFDGFKKNGLDATWPTFGKQIKEEIARRGGADTAKEKWELVQSVLTELNGGRVYTYDQNDEPQLSLFRPESTYDEFTSSIEALNNFFSRSITKVGYTAERGRLLSSISGKIKKARSYIYKTKRQLEALQKSNNYRIWGDNLMANLYNIPKGASSVTLTNVYDGLPLSLKLNPRLSVQENAERFYKKHKNQHIELESLEKSIKKKESELSNHIKSEQMLRAAENLRDLRKITNSLSDPPGKKSEKEESKPYWEKEVMGFRILIGKHARANDEMLRSHSRKNDLWLHAKDVPGSHVLIMHKADQNYPKPVIERAAGYAAWYSKRRSDSLCPVICTPRKYVRKRKGDPPGAVVVEKEEVLLVVPEG